MVSASPAGLFGVYVLDRYVCGTGRLSITFRFFPGKRFCEPKSERRSWLIWFYDTSKQGMGALVIHLANVYLAGMFQGDPCTWYIINFLLDSSVGLFIIYIGIRLSQHLAKTRHWEAINFGEYGKPPSVNAWMAQCGLYIGLMVVVKICITLLIQFDFWDQVRDFILSPINNPKMELAFVMLIIPFFVNVSLFCSTRRKFYNVTKITEIRSLLTKLQSF